MITRDFYRKIIVIVIIIIIIIYLFMRYWIDLLWARRWAA